VSRWYKAAIADAPDVEELADRVIAALPELKRALVPPSK
jgi:hypothetical protein